jgi:hypothetical protein
VSAAQGSVQPAEGLAAELYAPPSREQLFWSRHLAWLLAPPGGRPSLLARAWGVVAVAPFAHITFFSLFYQAYLYDVFHQTKNARFWHQVCMPLNNLMLMAALAPVSIAGTDGRTAYAALLLAWYLAQAVTSRLWLWGLAMIPVVGALHAGAGLYLRATATAGILASPFLWMALLSLVQAVSHVSEPRLPPRVTASSRWKTVREFLAGPPLDGPKAGGRTVRLLRLAAQVVWGTLAEFWAAPRLLPYGVLAQLRARGYARRRLEALDRMTRRAIASGQPAVDFIGSGGGAFLQSPAADPPPDGVLPRRWRTVFAIELPLTAGACLYWTLAAPRHLEAMFGPGTASPAALTVLAQLTAVVFSLVVWFYGRWLLGRGEVQLRPFRYLQEGFAIGDVVLIAVAAHCLRTGAGTPALWIAQLGMAGLWLAVRVLFLIGAP